MNAIRLPSTNITLPVGSALSLALALTFAAGCSGSPEDASDTSDVSEGATTGNVSSKHARGDGSYDVLCRDGRHEIATASDLSAHRVCRPTQLPASPFTSTCSGTPLTAAAALARLPRGTKQGAAPVTIGRFEFALRHRTEHVEWDAQWNRWSVQAFTWDDAPNDALIVWHDSGEDGDNSGVQATFGSKGNVQLGTDKTGAPYLRLVSDAVGEVGPDTSRRIRFVSAPLHPWATPGFAVGPTFSLEESTQDHPAWTPPTVPAGNTWTVEMKDLDATFRRSWWFTGNGVTAFATGQCAQFVSAQNQSDLSPVDSAIAIYASLAN